jgi:hypothetical protein
MSVKVSATRKLPGLTQTASRNGLGFGGGVVREHAREARHGHGKFREGRRGVGGVALAKAQEIVLAGERGKGLGQ